MVRKYLLFPLSICFFIFAFFSALYFPLLKGCSFEKELGLSDEEIVVLVKVNLSATDPDKTVKVSSLEEFKRKNAMVVIFMQAYSKEVFLIGVNKEGEIFQFTYAPQIPFPQSFLSEIKKITPNEERQILLVEYGKMLDWIIGTPIISFLVSLLLLFPAQFPGRSKINDWVERKLEDQLRCSE